MKVRTAASETAEPQEGDDLFEMANLFPHRTGLPMTVWVSPRGGARHDMRHDIRIKVNMTHGNQMNAANTAVVGVRGRLSPEDERLVFDWIAINTAALIAYWEGQIDTIDLGERLKPIPGASSTPTNPSAG